MHVLRVSCLRGRSTGHGCDATQKRTPAGLHTNLKLKTERTNG
jgi:hypothetical protein